MSINSSKKSLALTVIITLGFSLFYWGFATKFNSLLNGYGIVLLLLSLAFFFFKPKLEAKLDNPVVIGVLTLVMAIALGLSINNVVSKYVDGLWWAYIIGGAFLYAYAEEIAEWLA